MTRRDIAQWSIRNGLDLMPEEIDAIFDSANVDTDEGAEWLPFYKAALGILAEMIGWMIKRIESGEKPDAERVAAIKRAWLLNLWLGGIGPEQDAAKAAYRKAFAEGETNAAFFALEELTRPTD